MADVDWTAVRAWSRVARLVGLACLCVRGRRQSSVNAVLPSGRTVDKGSEPFAAVSGSIALLSRFQAEYGRSLPPVEASVGTGCGRSPSRCVKTGFVVRFKRSLSGFCREYLERETEAVTENRLAGSYSQEVDRWFSRGSLRAPRALDGGRRDDGGPLRRSRTVDDGRRDAGTAPWPVSRPLAGRTATGRRA